MNGASPKKLTDTRGGSRLTGRRLCPPAAPFSGRVAQCNGAKRPLNVGVSRPPVFAIALLFQYSANLQISRRLTYRRRRVGLTRCWALDTRNRSGDTLPCLCPCHRIAGSTPAGDTRQPRHGDGQPQAQDDDPARQRLDAACHAPR